MEAWERSPRWQKYSESLGGLDGAQDQIISYILFFLKVRPLNSIRNFTSKQGDESRKVGFLVEVLVGKTRKQYICCDHSYHLTCAECTSEDLVNTTQLVWVTESSRTRSFQIPGAPVASVFQAIQRFGRQEGENEHVEEDIFKRVTTVLQKTGQMKPSVCSSLFFPPCPLFPIFIS